MNFNTQKAFLRFTTVLISTAGLSLVLGFFLFFKNINNLISAWGEVEKVTVYLDSDASDTEVNKLKIQIEKLPDVKGVKIVSKEEAVEDFKAQVAGYIKDIKKDANLMQLIPSYLEVSVDIEGTFEKTVDKLNVLSKQIESLDFIEEVSYGSVWLDKYSRLVDYTSNLAGFIGIILVASTFLVISNLIKTNLYQRSKEIEVLEMIGATKSYIRKPFLIEGVLMSLSGGMVSIILVWGIFNFINTKFETQMKFFKLDQMFTFLSVYEAILFLVATVVLGYLASYFNLVRFKWNPAK